MNDSRPLKARGTAAIASRRGAESLTAQPQAAAATGPRLLFTDNGDEALTAAVKDLLAQGSRRVAFLPFDERARRIVDALGPAAQGCELFAMPSPLTVDLPPAVRLLPSGDAADAIVVPLESGEALGAALVRFVDLERGTVVAPRTDWHFRQRPLFLISIPKAGTHLLYELAKAFGYDEGVATHPQAARPGHWYCIEYSNSHTSARHFFIDAVRENPFGNRAHPFMRSPAIFIYRDPRGILFSEANYYHQDGNSPFAAYLAHLPPKERLLRLIDDPWLFGSFRDRMAEFVPWFELPNVIPVSFEELVGPSGNGDAAMQRRLIWSLQLKLQVPGDPSAFARQVFNQASPTFFTGKIGAWRTEFTPDVAKRFAALPQDFMEAFGYRASAGRKTAPYSTRIEEFRRREPSFSKADFSRTPFAVEYGFLGHNLVQFRNQFYAIAEAAGPVDLAAVPEGELAKLPRADTPELLKHLVAASMTKPADMTQELKSTIANTVSAALREELARAMPARSPPVKTSSTPQMLESVHGYNLVAYGGHYYGVLQRLGAVDLEDPASRESFALRAEHALLIADSLGELKERIARLAVEARLAAATAALDDTRAAIQQSAKEIAARDEKLTALGAQTAQLTHDVSSRDQNIAALEARTAQLAHDISLRDQKVLALERRATDLSNKLSSRDQDIAAETARVIALQNEAAGLAGGNAALEKRLDATLAEVAAAAAARGKLARNLADLQDKLARNEIARRALVAEVERHVATLEGLKKEVIHLRRGAVNRVLARLGRLYSRITSDRTRPD